MYEGRTSTAVPGGLLHPSWRTRRNVAVLAGEKPGQGARQQPDGLPGVNRGGWLETRGGRAACPAYWERSDGVPPPCRCMQRRGELVVARRHGRALASA